MHNLIRLLNFRFRVAFCWVSQPLFLSLRLGELRCHWLQNPVNGFCNCGLDFVRKLAISNWFNWKEMIKLFRHIRKELHCKTFGVNFGWFMVKIRRIEFICDFWLGSASVVCILHTNSTNLTCDIDKNRIINLRRACEEDLGVHSNDLWDKIYIYIVF